MTHFRMSAVPALAGLGCFATAEYHRCCHERCPPTVLRALLLRSFGGAATISLFRRWTNDSQLEPVRIGRNGWVTEGRFRCTCGFPLTSEVRSGAAGGPCAVPANDAA